MRDLLYNGFVRVYLSLKILSSLITVWYDVAWISAAIVIVQRRHVLHKESLQVVGALAVGLGGVHETEVAALGRDDHRQVAAFGHLNCGQI